VSPPNRIIVGVDGSEDSARAVEWSADLASALGCEVVAVHALGLLAHLGTSGKDSSDRHRSEIQSKLEGEWTAALRSASVSCRSFVFDGNPVTALMMAVEKERADLVVVGMRGTGGFPGLQLGSTSHQLVQHSTCPVVVVPNRSTPP